MFGLLDAQDKCAAAIREAVKGVKWMKQNIKQIEELVGQYRDDAVDESKRAAGYAAQIEEVKRMLREHEGDDSVDVWVAALRESLDATKETK